MLKKPQFGLIAILILILVLSSFNIVDAATIMVPDDYSTIQDAIDAANSGDTIIVKNGTYQESIVIDKAITLIAQSFDSDNPVKNSTFIKGGGIENTAHTIRIESGIAGTVVIRGFVISDGDDLISAASQVSIEYNYFHSGKDLIDTELGAGGFIRGNIFVHAGDDSIDIDDAIYPLVIEDNRIYASHDDGIETRLQAASAPAERIAIIIQNNQFIGNNRTGMQFIDYIADPQDTNRLFIVRGNLFARNHLAGIGFMGNEQSIEDLSGADIVEPVYTYNNTFYQNNYALSGGDNHVVFNNIFANNKVAVSRVAGNEGDDSVVAYNLFYENTNYSIDSTMGVGNIFDQDPQFQYLPNPGIDGKWDTPDDDYNGLILQASSPAIDVGLTQYITNSGILVPSPAISHFDGSAPDLGWKELFAASPTPGGEARAGRNIIFPSVAAAQVNEAAPNMNYSQYPSMTVAGGYNSAYFDYLRFEVTGIDSPIIGAKIRVYAESNTMNGPAVYASYNSWSEDSITWKNRPLFTSFAFDDLTTGVEAHAWFEMDVTDAIAGNGVYTFVLATTNTDDLILSSREGNFIPELIVIIEGNQDTSQARSDFIYQATPTATETAIPTSAAINPPQVPKATSTPTEIPVTYYVDCVNGNDNNSGTSPALAWMSLTHASTVPLNPGDTILLKQGCTWTEESLSIASNGLRGQPILISSYGTGALPIIYNSTSTPQAVELLGSHIIVENIHAIANETVFDANCDNNPVGFIVGFSLETGAHGNIIKNSIAEGFYAGISIYPGANSNKVLNNQLIDNIMMSPLDLTPNNDAGAFGILVRGNNNEIAYNQISGSDACSYDYGRDGSAVEIYGGSNNIIHHNYATESDIFSELGNPATRNNSYYYNVFSSSLTESKFIVTRGNLISLGPVSNTSVYNNTVYLTGSQAEGFVCHAGCNPGILTMYNNIFHVVNYRVGFADAPFDEDYNLFWGGAAVGFTPGPNTILADPLFVSQTTGDFHLQASSPAINAGLDLGFPLDFDGNSVPFGVAPEIGAYENISVFAAASINSQLQSVNASLLDEATATALATLTATYTATNIPTQTAVPSSTPSDTASPTFVPSLTPTDTASPTFVPSPTPSYTATMTPVTFVSNIDASTELKGASNNWVVTVNVTVRDEQSKPLSGVTVHASWGGAFTGSVSGTTDANGFVSFDTGVIKGTSVSFTVTELSHPTHIYTPNNNSDPDGDSNGTSITISHP